MYDGEAFQELSFDTEITDGRWLLPIGFGLEHEEVLRHERRATEIAITLNSGQMTVEHEIFSIDFTSSIRERTVRNSIYAIARNYRNSVNFSSSEI